MRKTDELLKKYWEGKTTLDEENWLKEHVDWDGSKSGSEIYFNHLKNKSEEKITDGDFDKQVLDQINQQKTKTRSFPGNYWRVAAAFILLITAGIVLNKLTPDKPREKLTGNEIVIVDTYDDPEKAYEETKKALMFLSGKLNEGAAYTLEIKKFNESQEILKNE